MDRIQNPHTKSSVLIRVQSELYSIFSIRLRLFCSFIQNNAGTCYQFSITVYLITLTCFYPPTLANSSGTSHRLRNQKVVVRTTSSSKPTLALPLGFRLRFRPKQGGYGGRGGFRSTGRVRNSRGRCAACGWGRVGGVWAADC